MKLLLPREHGAWAMWIAPLLIGITTTKFKWTHMLLIISVFFVYIAMSAFLQGLRRPKDRPVVWKHTFIYLVVAVIIGSPLLYLFPKLILIPLFVTPFFLINLYFIKQKNERSKINDLIGILVLSSTIFASYYIGALTVDYTTYFLWAVNVLFFFGSVLYIKSLFREKEHRLFKILGKLYSGVLPILILYFLSDKFLTLAFLFSTGRMLYNPYGDKITSKKAGIIEIINTVWFVIFVNLSFYL